MAQPEAPAKRGRPRPQSTIDRDEKAYAVIAAAGEAGVTKTQLATELGDLAKGAYLSLYRLRTTDRIERAHVDGKHVWRAKAA